MAEEVYSLTEVSGKTNDIELMDSKTNDNELIGLKTNDIELMALRMRKMILDMSLFAGGAASHFGAGLSITDILATLYGGIMNLDKTDPTNNSRDRFILSKGHGVLGYYAALACVGYLSESELQEFEKTNSILAGHPVMNRKKGIEFSTGSLGMGLSLGIGVALAAKKRNMSYKTYVLMGDGECNEGSVWEAMMAASHFKLNNLTAVIDHNKYQLGGLNDEIMSVGDIARKTAAFGFDVIEVDGHNIKELYNSFITEAGDKPKMIIAHTVKGKGFSFSENNNAWHHAVLTKRQYELALEELEGKCDLY
jgi:transketolase